MARKSPYALDVIAILKLLDRRNFDVYKSLEQDEAKRRELIRSLGYVLPLFMSGSNNEEDHYALLTRFNVYANQGWWRLRNHPELQLKLLAAIGLGKQTFHAFMNASKRTTFGGLQGLLQQIVPDIRSAETLVWCRKNSEADVRRLGEDCGLSDEEIETLINDHRKALGTL